MKVLEKKEKELFYFEDGVKILGQNPNMEGDCTELWGNCSALWGNCSGLSGDCTGLWGDCSDLRGNLDLITKTMREKSNKIEDYC